MKNLFLVALATFLALLFAIGDSSAVAQSMSKPPTPNTSSSPDNSKDKTDQADKALQPALSSFPGLAEVVSRAAEITRSADDTREKIAANWDISSLSARILAAEWRLKKLQDQIAEMGDPGGWDYNRLSDMKILIRNERKGFDTLVAPISSRLNDLKSIRQDWEMRRTFWEEWRKSLASTQVEVPSETFDQAQATIKSILDSDFNATALIVSLQERVSRLVQDTIKLSKPIEDALARQRSETFKKVEPSFFSRDFPGQLDLSFGPNFLENFSNNWVKEDLIDYRFWWRLIGVLLLSGLIVYLRRSGNVLEKRSFFFDHPLSVSVFISEVLAGLFLPEPTGLWRYGAWSLFALSSSVLASDSLKERHARYAVYFLTTLVVLTDIVKSMSNSTGINRLYLATATFVGMAAFSMWAAQTSPRLHRDKIPLKTALWAGALVMAIATASQALGFVNLSDRLIFSLSGTVFVLIGASILWSMGGSAIELLLTRPLIAKQSFVIRFGEELAARIKTVLRAAICYIAFVSLLRILGIYTSKGQVLHSFFKFHVTIGQMDLSLGLVLLAILMIYIARSISWFVCAILETEVFPRKEVDRGVSHAVRKLVHYSIIFIGFMAAASVLGLNLSSFVVLGSALGIGIGFGLQNIVNNFISGLILLFERPVKVGDIVAVDGDTGRVTQIGLRSTCIETVERSELIVPNSQFISQKVTNWTFKDRVARLRIPVGVDYGSDIDLVLSLLKKAGASNPRVLSNPEPLPLMLRFADYSLDFELSVWVTNAAERHLACSEICQAIAGSFKEHGIEIPFPRRDICLRTQPEESQFDSAMLHSAPVPRK